MIPRQILRMINYYLIKLVNNFYMQVTSIILKWKCSICSFVIKIAMGLQTFLRVSRNSLNSVNHVLENYFFILNLTSDGKNSYTGEFEMRHKLKTLESSDKL
jgi:hypothetical protein